MFIKPNFIRNNEEWIIWLLAEEFSGSASLPMIAERTHLPQDQVHDNILYLERIKALNIKRDPAKRYPDEIEKVTLIREGKEMYEELKQRKDLDMDDILQ